MTESVLTKTRIRAGVWEGVLEQSAEAEAPTLDVRHLEQSVAGVTVTAEDASTGRYLVRVPIPAELLSDGVQTFLILEKNSGDKLASFTIVTGELLEDDIRAEMDLLRAELDMLKKAFRRHCLETS
ncbi:hypothetical protein ATO10_07597 [Actibacterium atlanticum]|uniref:Uncharacterized protein n=1 Tax=Actibacterium atlanticum TaxID=1461693 RepID=A0A058ZN84_9RHOB|nr:hypothetical protein [Actibacterium atlanticum]KCV82236.1 hypothetical protein ATO10_07597 [Actibacterium atlanticum]